MRYLLAIWLIVGPALSAAPLSRDRLPDRVVADLEYEHMGCTVAWLPRNEKAVMFLCVNGFPCELGKSNHIDPSYTHKILEWAKGYKITVKEYDPW